MTARSSTHGKMIGSQEQEETALTVVEERKLAEGMRESRERESTTTT